MMAVSAVFASPVAAVGPVRSAVVSPEVTELELEGVDRGAALARGAGALPPTDDGEHPQVFTAPMDTPTFAVLGFTWDPDSPDVTIKYRVRASDQWSEWEEIEPGHVPDSDSRDASDGERPGTDPVVTGEADGLQVWASADEGTVTGLRAVLVTVPQAPADAMVAPLAAAAVPGQPPIISRAGWGADESLRTCAPSYSAEMPAVAVHHTASSNVYTPEQVPGLIRGFYAYHVQGRGWCDIGYNFLVDRYGRVFEGRAGGITSPVVGVHTGGFNSRTIGVSAIGDFSSDVPAAVIDALVSLISWKAAIHGIYAAGNVTLVSGGGDSKFPAGTVVTFPAIYGHRDAQHTACPGAMLYAQLPTIRARVAAAADGAVVTRPIGTWESLQTTPTSVSVAGWALVPTSPVSLDVTVRVGGAVKTERADKNRPDVALVFPAAGAAHGFSITVPVRPGSHWVCLEIERPGGAGPVSMGCRQITIRNQAPVGNIESARISGGELAVSGWAFDPDTAGPTDVHIYVNGVGVAVRADLPRPDVGLVFGRGPENGFSYTRAVGAGAHTVCVYAIDTAGGPASNLGCRVVQVVNRAPVGVIDQVAVSGGQLTVSGWAFDPDTAGSTDVHVYVNGVGAAMRANLPRPDVGAVYGRSPESGFTYTRAVGAGAHTVCVYAIDTAGGPASNLGCRVVQVVNRAPVGFIDQVVVSGGEVHVSGWAFDPDSAGSTVVHVYVDGIGQQVAANIVRPDVGAVFGRDPRTGFVATRAVAPGPHLVCVYAIDTWSGPATNLGCRTVVR